MAEAITEALEKSPFVLIKLVFNPAPPVKYNPKLCLFHFAAVGKFYYGCIKITIFFCLFILIK